MHVLWAVARRPQESTSGGLVSTVAQLLQQSRSAHDAYRMALPRYNPKTGQHTPGDAVAATQHLQRALDLRAQAEQADPAGMEPGWTPDALIHYDILKFSDQQLQKAKLVETPVFAEAGVKHG